jgi:hypothetical protein
MIEGRWFVYGLRQISVQRKQYDKGAAAQKKDSLSAT